jgi:hypothetical protein
MTDAPNLNNAADGGLRTTALFGLELQPYQQRMVDMMLSMPEGVKWRLMVGRGRFSGSYGEKDGKLTHRWDGKQWVSLPNDKTQAPT